MGYGNGGTGSGTITSYSGAAIGVAVATAPRQPIIAEQMVALDGRTETLSSMVAELEARIASVLMTEGPSTSEKPLQAPHPNVQLGASLAQMNDRLLLITHRLRNVIERVEL